MKSKKAHVCQNVTDTGLCNDCNNRLNVKPAATHTPFISLFHHRYGTSVGVIQDGENVEAFWARVDGYVRGEYPDQSFEMAALPENIVRAVNAHETMLGALKEAVENVEVYNTNPALVELFKYAIAKAEGVK